MEPRKVILLSVTVLTVSAVCFLVISLIATLQQQVSNSNNKERKTFSVRHCEGGKYIPLYRLPTNLIPLHYDVHLRPILDNGDPDQFTAPGKIAITILCVQPTKSISLHSLVASVNETSIQVTDIMKGVTIDKAEPGKINSTEQTYTITLNDFLEFNMTYKIYMEFVASVAKDPEGLYRSRYYQDGHFRYMATTQFELTEARKAFPCFDEPALKATFKFHIGYNNRTGYHTLGNMNIVNTRPDADLSGWMWNEYATTVNMSTYLIAFVVSDFIYQEAPEGLYRKPVKVWGRKNIIEKNNDGLYGAITIAKSLEFFEQYFNQTYDLPKMDAVGVLDYPSNIAMENWGLLTFRQDALFFFENVTMEARRKTMTLAMAHEVAHQWFGNLITMNWWNDVWLNEGLTMFAANLATNHTNPEFDSLNTEAVTQMQNAMECDVDASTMPLSSYKFRPNVVVYCKGGSLIRMVQAFLGETTFLKGLRNYFNDRKYANAIQDDLFRNINAAAQEDGVLPVGLNVKEILDTWTLQSGFPLIRVTKLKKSGISISQERHKHVVHETTINSSEYWWVPITYATQSTPALSDYKPKTWLGKTTVLINLTVSEVDLDNNWILLNPDARSYYRVIYDNGLTALIKNQLDNDHSVFKSASRSQILDDYFTAAYNGYIPIETALSLTTYLGKEDTLIVWAPVLKHLRKAYLLFQSNEFELLVNYLGPRLNATLHLIGPKQSVGEKGVVVILRALLLEWACEMRLNVCRNYALELYEEWMTKPEKNPDIRNTMVCAGMAAVIADQLNMTQSFPLSRRYLLIAMSCQSDAEILQRWLSVAFTNESLLKRYEASSFLHLVASNSRRNDIALQFLEQKFSQIFAYYSLKTGSRLVESLFRTFAGHFYTDETIERMEKIISSHSKELSPVSDKLFSHIQTIKDNSQWMKAFGRDMINYFKNH